MNTGTDRSISSAVYSWEQRPARLDSPLSQPERSYVLVESGAARRVAVAVAVLTAEQVTDRALGRPAVEPLGHEEAPEGVEVPRRVHLDGEECAHGAVVRQPRLAPVVPALLQPRAVPQYAVAPENTHKKHKKQLSLTF